VEADGSWLASASYDKRMRIWGPATGTARHTLTGHTDGVVRWRWPRTGRGWPPPATTGECGSWTPSPAHHSHHCASRTACSTFWQPPRRSQLPENTVPTSWHSALEPNPRRCHDLSQTCRLARCPERRSLPGCLRSARDYRASEFAAVARTDHCLPGGPAPRERTRRVPQCRIAR
jgi:hypothetical protein